MLKFLDRLFTRKVICRNCPNYRPVRKQLAATGDGERSITLGVCAIAAPVIANYPTTAEALQVRYTRDWCPSHPLYDPLTLASDPNAAPLAYAPGHLTGAGLKDHAGFSRPPSLAEAAQFAPGAPEFERRYNSSDNSG